MDLNLSPSYNYNQKAAIKEWIIEFINTHKINIFLDIGAGFPETAVAFKNAVAIYTAIEKDRERSKRLRDFEVDVINDSFPCAVSGTYDLVLASHSIPENTDEYFAFFSESWKLVSQKGYLIIITFKGVRDALTPIRSEFKNVKMRAFEEVKFNKLVRVLNGLGKHYITHIISVETSKDPNDIAQTLCISLGDKKEQHIEKLRDIIKSRFGVEDGYYFPHVHNIIVMQKN